MMCKNMCGMACLVGAGVMVGVLSTSLVSAQPEAEVDLEAQMEAWIKANQPGPQHEKLAQMAGEWTFEMKDLRGGDVSKGTQSNKMALGGRFLMSHVNTDFDGKPFEGMGALGYDNMSGKYVSAWLDSMTTAIMSHEGQEAEDGTIVLKGTMMGGEMASKHVYRFDGPDSFTFEMYEGMAGSELSKTGLITYTRN